MGSSAGWVYGSEVCALPPRRFVPWWGLLPDFLASSFPVFLTLSLSHPLSLSLSLPLSLTLLFYTQKMRSQELGVLFLFSSPSVIDLDLHWQHDSAWMPKYDEDVSFEAAEWSERLTSRRVGWLGAAAAGSIPALVTFFSFSSLLLLLFLSSLSKA